MTREYCQRVIMEGNDDCEPLNLVTKRPAFVEVAKKRKCNYVTEAERVTEDSSPKKRVDDWDEHVVEDVNRNYFWGTTGHVFKPEDAHNSVLSAINSLALSSWFSHLYARNFLPNQGHHEYLRECAIPHMFPPRIEDGIFSREQSFLRMIQASAVAYPQKNTCSPPDNSSLPDTLPTFGSSSQVSESEDIETVTKKKQKKQKRSVDHKNSSLNDGKSQDSGHGNNNQDKKKPHIKKPLNAFMLYMKEMRAKVVAECTLKESAAINQILGRRWHSLTREEQAKYYEKARQERQLHMELYPGWSARDNYGYGAKKKKRKKERVPISDNGGNSMKKCRARYGLDQQSQWCKPCRRKKKCVRYMECGDDSNPSEDNLGSCGSVGDAQSPPDDDGESFQNSMSSPGGLSGLSSLTSPSMILPSPCASLASPSVSLASPCMSLQSPLTPHQIDYECVSSKPPCLPLLINHHLQVVPPPRNPVGTNPHDINNPLSVNQLTGKCIKNSSPSSGAGAVATSSGQDTSSRPVISVT